MHLEAIGKSFRFRLLTGEKVRFQPGVPIDLPEPSAKSLLKLAGDKVRIVDAPLSRSVSTLATESTEPLVAPLNPPAPTAPLQVGWLIAYRDRKGRLRGGSDERPYGTVTGCHWSGESWRVTVLNGTSVSLSRITSVGKTDHTGAVVAAWTVREHGHNGEGTT